MEDLSKNTDNRVSVDCFSAYIVGYAWREWLITTERVKSYYKSDDFWQRRIAIVATVALNQKARGGTVDPEKNPGNMRISR